MAKKKLVYPRTLYKSPGSKKITIRGQRYTYDSVIVEDEEEALVAKTELGYIDGFADALFGAQENEDETPIEEEQVGGDPEEY